MDYRNRKRGLKAIALILSFCIVFGGLPLATGSFDVHAAVTQIKVTATCKGWTNTVALKWNRITNPQQGYAVIVDGKVWTHLGKTTTAYTVKGIKSGTKHSFRVRTWRKVRSKMWYNTRTKKWQWTDPGARYRGRTNYGMRIVYGTCSPLVYATTAKAKYTIKYDANGGTGAPANGVKVQDTAYKVSAVKPKRNGYRFTGWTIVETNYKNLQPGGTIAANCNRSYTLRAQWVRVYTIRYDANGGTGAPAMGGKLHNSAYTVSSTVPTRDGYKFTGWTIVETGYKNLQPGATISADSNANYTLKAQWELIPIVQISYTITWKNYDGTVLQSGTVKKDETPSYTGPQPVKPEDDDYTYTFAGFTPNVTKAIANATYTATFRAIPKEKYFTITWKNWDGTVLKEDSVLQNTVPSYTGTTPAKPEDDNNTYAFSGWDKTVVKATADTVYTATFTATAKPPKKFTITWKNWDGEVLATDSVTAGTVPVYAGEAPAREADDEYTYTFTGWDPNVAEASADTVYTAVFESEAKPVIPDTSDLDAARERLETAEQNLSSAEETLNDAESALEEARNTEAEKKAAYDALLPTEEEIAAADSNIAEKAEALETAKTNVNEKQSVYDNIGKAFLDSGSVCWTSEKLKQTCLASDELKDMIGTSELDNIINDCTKVESIRGSLDYIRESNVIRAGLGLDPLKVSYDLMNASVYGVAYYPSSEGHAFVLNNSLVKGNIAENLVCDNYDPFDAWYYEEKIHFLAEQNGTAVTQDLYDTVKAEATENGHPFARGEGDDYLEYLNRIYENDTYSTGHYKNIISTSIKGSGFAWSPATHNFEQCFSSKLTVYEKYVDENGNNKRTPYTLVYYDVDTFEQQLDDFVAESESNLNEAKAALETAQAEYDAAVAAKEELTSGNSGSAKAEWDSAVEARIAAETAYNVAKDAYDAALEERDAAQEAYDAISNNQ